MKTHIKRLIKTDNQENIDLAFNLLLGIGFNKIQALNFLWIHKKQTKHHLLNWDIGDRTLTIGNVKFIVCPVFSVFEIKVNNQEIEHNYTYWDQPTSVNNLFRIYTIKAKDLIEKLL